MSHFYKEIHRTLLLAAALTLCLGWQGSAQAARLALVMGNSDYTVGALKNPINDAIAMGKELGALGFEVTTVRNLKRDAIGRTVEGFVGRIRAGDDVVVFYAGHGMQVKGVNYLPAVDANIHVESDVALNSLNLNQLLDRLDEAKAGVRLLLIDACRNNPYSRGFRSGARGLARVEGAPSGTLMHFATKPGGVADDGSGSNGRYTTELLKHLRTPGLAVESMLKRVASGVRQTSGGEQQPWTEGALDGEFYFAPVQTASLRPEATPTPRPLAEPVKPPEAPRPAAPTVDFGIRMVSIPAGSFTMGGNKSGSEQPIHTVTLKAFDMGATEVTQGQWKAVMGNNHSRLKDCGDTCPVESVSWDDAQTFIQKLNQQTGKRYRLPSEAEWEYAARAGTRTDYWWGNTASHEYANYGKDECCGGLARGRDRWENTAPAAQFPANAFGLHDMHGNVWEWVQDWYHDNYNGAPTDGSAWESGGEQKDRVLRGGSWYNYPAYLRSANRSRSTPDIRDYISGFRVARTVP